MERLILGFSALLAVFLGGFGGGDEDARPVTQIADRQSSRPGLSCGSCV